MYIMKTIHRQSHGGGGGGGGAVGYNHLYMKLPMATREQDKLALSPGCL